MSPDEYAVGVVKEILEKEAFCIILVRCLLWHSQSNRYVSAKKVLGE